jgi:hypothetical protein
VYQMFNIGASAARPLATIDNTIVAKGFAAEAPIYYVYIICNNN